MNSEILMNNEVPTKPKFGKNKLIIIAIVVCALLIGIAGGVYAVINSDPKVKVLKGIKATSDELKNNQSIFEKVVGKDYFKTLEDKGTKGNGEFSLNGTSFPELSQYNGAGISFDYAYDKKNKKLSLDYAGQYKGTKVVDAKFYTDNNKLMISIPQIYDAWFTCDAENIQEQYNNSLFGKSSKLPNNEITLKVFDDDKVLSGKELADAILQGYLKANAEKLATIGKNIKVEKSKETKNVEIGGASQECTGYDVVITGQDAKEFIESISDYMLQDEELKKAITKSVKYSYLQQNKKYKSPEAMVEDIYEKMKEGNENFKKAFTCDDVKAVVYLDKKGRAVSIDLNTTINTDKEKVDVKYTNDFKGKDNLGDIVNASVELTNSKDNKIKINFDNTTTTKDDLVNQEINVALDADKTPINFNAKLGYNMKNGDFDASANMGAGQEGLTVSCAGNSKFDKSSKKLDLDFDKIDFKTNLKNNNVNFSFNGSYSVAPLDSPIEEPTGEKLEVFKLSQNKLVEVAQEAQKNAAKIASTLR